MKLQLGILTGKGIFCTIFATLVLIICCVGASEYMPIFILVYVVWELYVNAYYSSELKCKKQILELKIKMENEPYGSSLYNTYKHQYDSLINSEKLRKACQMAATLGTLAATHSVIDKFNKEEMQKTKKLLKINKLNMDKISLMTDRNGGSISDEEYNRRSYDIDKRIEEIREEI